MAFMNLRNIDVCYNKKNKVLKQLSLEVEQGELISLLGPSGCGKTTTLRVVAGFIEPQAGSFILNGKDMTHLPIEKRNFGLMFQSYALFPHLSVYDNVAFGLKMRKTSKDAIQKKVLDMIEVVGLKGFENRFPNQMSGGQNQRVALARALVIQPDLLLLDEPLSNLDAKLRIAMRSEIKRLQKKAGITTLFVTHDQEECFSISDRVAVMNKGVIEQFDTPETIYSHPKTEFVARFIGFENFLKLSHIQGTTYVTKNNIRFIVENSTGQKNCVGTLRPDDIAIIEQPKETNTIQGSIGVRTFLGKRYQYEVQTDLGKFLVNCSTDYVYKEGERINLFFNPKKLILVQTSEN